MNVTGTVVPAAATVTMHDPVPLHGAPHAEVEPALGVAVRVTCVPGAREAEQVAPQLRLPPVHDAATVPVPVPDLETTKLAFLSTKVALTVADAAIDVIVHVAPLVAVQPPDQLWKFESAPGTAVSTTVEPTVAGTTQLAAVQLMPPVPVTLPFPVCWIVTDTVVSAKFAVTDVGAMMAAVVHVALAAGVQPVHDEKP